MCVICNFLKKITNNLQKFTKNSLQNTNFVICMLAYLFRGTAVMFRLQAVIYAKEQNEKIFKLKNVLKEKGINAEIDTDFASVIVRAKNSKPDILIMDGCDYVKNQVAMNLFREDMVFGVRLVIVASESVISLADLPKNYRCKAYEEISQFILDMRDELILQKENLDDADTRAEQTHISQQVLLDLGFNACSFGTNYIWESILGVMGINCRPKSLSKTIYAEVSRRNGTTVGNLLKCTMNALGSAWKRRNRVNNKRLASGISFDDFKLCPTVKEFIYYVARKLTLYLETQHKDEEFFVNKQINSDIYGKITNDERSKSLMNNENSQNFNSPQNPITNNLENSQDNLSNSQNPTTDNPSESR